VNVLNISSLVMFFSLAVNAFAATSYVATNGNNGNPGTQTQPWRTLKYAAVNISTGDTVIVRGGTYKEYFTINTANVTFQNYPGESPIVDGGRITPSVDQYDTTIMIKANDVTIDGLTVRNSACYGIYIKRAKNVTIRNVEVYECYRTCLVIMYGANNALIEDCDFHHGGKAFILWNQKISREDPANVVVKYSDRPIFRRTKIHDSYNEGILMDVGTSNAIIEYCEIYGNPKVQLYLCASTNNIIRYNLIYGTNNGSGSGIYFSHESQWVSDYGNPIVSNSKVYGNLVANTNQNIAIGGANHRQVTNVQVYNNTLVEALECGLRVASGTGGGHIFKNNIIWQTNKQIANIPSRKVTRDYNLWSRDPGNARGAHDPSYTLPKLTKTSGWNSLSGGDLDGSEFALQSASSAIDAGIPIGAEFDNIPECNKSVWSGQIVVMDQDNQGSGWEIGADIHVTNSTALDPPTGLTIANSP